MTDVELRELTTEAEWVAAFPVMNQLRTDLDEAQYLDYLERMTAEGYRLFGLFVDGDVAAVAGVEILTNMYYGRHLWVFDLVTDADHRSRGFGHQLFQHLTEWATARDCETIALESGLQRERAHQFYEENVGMNRESYVYSMNLT